MAGDGDGAAASFECRCCGGTGTVELYGACPLCDGNVGGTKQTDQADDDSSLWAVAEAIVNNSAEGQDGMPSDSPAPFWVEEIDGRGVGARASRPIRPGELILAERPLISLEGTEAIRRLVEAECADLAAGVGTADMRQVNTLAAQDSRLSEAVAAALAALDAPHRAAFLALSDCFGAGDGTPPQAGPRPAAGPRVGSCVEEVGKVHAVSEDLSCKPSVGSGGIFLTNAVSASTRDLAHVYARGSRLNHSCRPNAIVLEQDQTRRIFAAIAIGPGEEICIPYIEDFVQSRCHEALRAKVRSAAGGVGLDPDLLLVALMRQQLYVKWGFWCQCSRCGPVAAKADKMLQTWCELL